MATIKKDVYQMVTDKICDELSKGIIPWHKPWVCNAEDGAISYTSREPYSLLNQMLLGEPGEYITWKQCKALGGNVNRGAKARMIVFFTLVESKTEVDEEGQPKVYPCLKYYNVFRISDTDLPSKLESAPANTHNPIETAENIIAGYLSRESLTYHNDKPSNEAYYSPMMDSVVVPMMSQYAEVEEYYSTAFHELVHSTSHKERCDRPEGRENIRFGSANYSREELVAEMGSAMLCTISGIDHEKAFKNSVAYIQGWLKALGNDKHMIVWAASRAEKAAKYINQ